MLITLRKLRQRGIILEIVIQALYSLLILLLFAFPAICNLQKHLRNRLENVEKRVFKIIGGEVQFPTLFSVGDKMCSKLFSQVISDDQHPLRTFFIDNHFVGVRNFCTLRKPTTKTKRFGHSCLKYCN